MIKRKGTIYFLVLASAVVLVASVSAISFAIMYSRKVTQSLESIGQTEVYAELGIRHAIHFTNQVPTWRTTLTNGTWIPTATMGNASYTVSGVDTFDANLANDESQRVTLACQVTIDDVTRVHSVQSQQYPLDVLSYAISANNIEFDTNAQVTGNVYTQTNILMRNTNSSITGNTDATGNITNLVGATITGIKTTLVPQKTIPTPGDILAYYQAKATLLPYINKMTNHTLSKTTNTYSGTVNPEGIYWIDCGGQKFELDGTCVITGTLIVTNFGTGGNSFRIDDYSYVTKDASLNNPAILASGGQVYLECDSALNPITGLVYVDANLDVAENQAINGIVIVTKTLTCNQNSNITFNAINLPQTPTKFRNHYLTPVANTWQ